LEQTRNETRLNGSYRITRKRLKKNQGKNAEVAWNIQKQIKKNRKKKNWGREGKNELEESKTRRK